MLKQYLILHHMELTLGRNISEMVDGNIKLSLKMVEISKKFNAKYIHSLHVMNTKLQIKK